MRQSERIEMLKVYESKQSLLGRVFKFKVKDNKVYIAQYIYRQAT